MTKPSRYSIYINTLDMPFRFQGSFKSRKAAHAATKSPECVRAMRVLVVPEEKPDLEVGAQATGWDEYPKNYQRPVRK
jgi:hypothetical protein